MVRLVTAAAVAALTASALADSTPNCDPNNKCPTDLPCCSQYGQCGVGAYCLGGCDPLSSNSLQSCVPAPVCKNNDYKFTSTNNIMPNTKYLGDPTKADWVSDGTPVQYQNDVLLTMAQGSVGTLLASSTYVWFGNISATLKTSRGQGVVTAFIMLSDVKDEIDYEFVGTDLTSAQSNYYFQGITNYDHEKNISLSDTFDNFHTYNIDWNPDQITWSVDGQVGRTLKKSDTFNKTSNQYNYPQTPARIQLSLWPAGLSSNGGGTVAWAGGLIDWNSQDVKNNGYYYATVQEVNVQCYSPPSNTSESGNISYTYNNQAGTQDTVDITGNPTVLKSLLGTGTNMSAGDSSSSGAPSASSQPASVPGLSGAGTGGTSSEHGGDSGSGSGGSGGSSSSSAAAATGTGFSQGNTNNGKPKGNNAPAQNERVLQGSLFAGMMAVIGMLLL